MVSQADPLDTAADDDHFRTLHDLLFPVIVSDNGWLPTPYSFRLGSPCPTAELPQQRWGSATVEKLSQLDEIGCQNYNHADVQVEAREVFVGERKRAAAWILTRGANRERYL
jgi:hypothetical protein